MLNKLNQAKEMMEAQKKANELKKQLETIQAEAMDGNVKIKLKGDISMYKIDSIEIDGVEIKNFKSALKKANKELTKKLQKKVKSGEIDMRGL